MKLLALTLPWNNGPVTIKPPGSIPDYYPQRYVILNNILALALSVLAIIAIGFLIWGGIQMIISEGDKQKVQAARSRITYAIIGLIVAFLSFFMVKLVGTLFSLDLLKLP